ncbi:hypothetical protein HDU91_001081, partial [Kappamyces sp. JEL0680]
MTDAQARQAASDYVRANVVSTSQVFAYVEANMVVMAMNNPQYVSIANTVLPSQYIDLVSYSAYDSQFNPALRMQALDYLQSKLVKRNGDQTRRAFVGEFGYALLDTSGKAAMTDLQQSNLALADVAADIAWGAKL